MNRVAVITDIHGNLPALEASLEAIDAIGVDALFCGGDLVGYGPHPNEVCRLIEDRAIPTIYGNYDYAIARELNDCGCAYVTQHDRELGQQSVAWTLAHTDQRSKDFMRALPFDLRFELGSHRSIWCTARRGRSTSTCSRTSPRSLYERLAAGREPTCLCSDTPTSPGSTPTAACCSSTAARSASPRTATRAPGSRSSSSTSRRAAGVDRARPLRRRGGRPRSRGGWPPRRVRREAGRRRIAREVSEMKYVLFVCTHNAGRSQMAQAFFERDCTHRNAAAESAGSDPARQVWPEVVAGDARGRDRPCRAQTQAPHRRDAASRRLGGDDGLRRCLPVRPHTRR